MREFFFTDFTFKRNHFPLLRVLESLKLKKMSEFRFIREKGASKMEKIKREFHCLKCKNSFYTSFDRHLFSCIHCGDKSVREGRNHVRTESFKPCEIIKGALKIHARITDISYGGIGIMAFVAVPLTTHEMMSIKIPFYTIRRVRLIWINKYYGVTRAGFAFFH